MAAPRARIGRPGPRPCTSTRPPVWRLEGLCSSEERSRLRSILPVAASSPSPLPPAADRWKTGSGSQCGQQFIQGNARNSGGPVAHGIGKDEFAAVEEGAAAVDDIGHVAFSFVVFWGKQGFCLLYTSPSPRD